ncbi:helix-turn-helix domain-containing protein [Bacillus sp. ISL-35]|uniref:PucR family transcriptional regulator n=1 Tax=Bacillus sp. ISL-35 TaxID=2819122 RepID=UPI001BECA85B|nr:helix-turn-helix domain-containing protein [Bacillus sp. ISL-35]MBT2678055.1 helix-turn-helix domain-containing protein [Bacillus sp. ISL-35]MBT2705730.1 helix-turn-helix domain-containing protein [Chryseobacterium sp. ISL-80]
MINKILAYFPDSVTHNHFPAHPSSEHHWFQFTEEEPIWISIPKEQISEDQLDLLKNLLQYIETDPHTVLTGKALAWSDFLFHGGAIPPTAMEEVRFIQFRLQAKHIETEEINEALQGFFPEHTILWRKDSYGMIIEEKKEIIEDADELQSISATFESDFFIKISFYIGKFQTISRQLPGFFTNEKQVFLELVKLTNRGDVFTFEKAFPMLLATQLPDHLQDILSHSILDAFGDDKELMTTIKTFLESNSNVSLAAKKLYVHRNTLQYRLDKFTEKTGVQLKDFDAAIVVYLAGLYKEMG